MKKVLALVLVAILCLGTLTACSVSDIKKMFETPQSELLVASWTDSNALSGYEFHDDGTVKITYANFTVPFINTNFNGTVDGAYTTSESEDGEKNYVTLTYTIFSKSIEVKYEYFVEDNVLTLIDIDDGDKTVYVKQTTTTAGTTAA